MKQNYLIYIFSTIFLISCSNYSTEPTAFTPIQTIMETTGIKGIDSEINQQSKEALEYKEYWETLRTCYGSSLTDYTLFCGWNNNTEKNLQILEQIGMSENFSKPYFISNKNIRLTCVLGIIEIREPDYYIKIWENSNKCFKFYTNYSFNLDEHFIYCRGFEVIDSLPSCRKSAENFLDIFTNITNETKNKILENDIYVVNSDIFEYKYNINYFYSIETEVYHSDNIHEIKIKNNELK